MQTQTRHNNTDKQKLHDDHQYYYKYLWSSRLEIFILKMKNAWNPTYGNIVFKMKLIEHVAGKKNAYQTVPCREAWDRVT